LEGLPWAAAARAAVVQAEVAMAAAEREVAARVAARVAGDAQCERERADDVMLTS
jgi:hypothetical protein